MTSSVFNVMNLLNNYVRRWAGRVVLGQISAGALVLGLVAATPPKAFAEETIQLAPLLVNAQIEGTSTIRQLPISVRLEVSTTKRADYVCSVYPLLRDSVVRYLNERHYPVALNGHLEIKGIGSQLRPVMTKAIQWDILDKIDVIQGSFELPSVIAARLTQSGCLRIDDGVGGKKKTVSAH